MKSIQNKPKTPSPAAPTADHSEIVEEELPTDIVFRNLYYYFRDNCPGLSARLTKWMEIIQHENHDVPISGKYHYVAVSLTIRRTKEKLYYGFAKALRYVMDADARQALGIDEKGNAVTGGWLATHFTEADTLGLLQTKLIGSDKPETDPWDKRTLAICTKCGKQLSLINGTADDSRCLRKDCPGPLFIKGKSPVQFVNGKFVATKVDVKELPGLKPATPAYVILMNLIAIGESTGFPVVGNGPELAKKTGYPAKDIHDDLKQRGFKKISTHLTGLGSKLRYVLTEEHLRAALEKETADCPLEDFLAEHVPENAMA